MGSDIIFLLTEADGKGDDEWFYDSLHRYSFLHKFFDGLSAPTFGEKDVEMYCHTWKCLSGSRIGVAFDLYHRCVANTVRLFEIHIVPYDCKHIHDSSGT